MKREFYIDTPLGQIRVWAKYETDNANDYPGVNIDLVDEKDGDIILSVVEYDPFKKNIQTCVYGDVNDENPSHIVELKNLPKPAEKRPHLVTIEEKLVRKVLVYADDGDDAVDKVQTLWDMSEIVLDADDFQSAQINSRPVDDVTEYDHLATYTTETYDEEEIPDEPEMTKERVVNILNDLLDYSRDMEKETVCRYGENSDDNPWYNDKRALEWVLEQLK